MYNSECCTPNGRGQCSLFLHFTSVSVYCIVYGVIHICMNCMHNTNYKYHGICCIILFPPFSCLSVDESSKSKYIIFFVPSASPDFISFSSWDNYCIIDRAHTHTHNQPYRAQKRNESLFWRIVGATQSDINRTTQPKSRKKKLLDAQRITVYIHSREEAWHGSKIGS